MINNSNNHCIEQMRLRLSYIDIIDQPWVWRIGHIGCGITEDCEYLFDYAGVSMIVTPSLFLYSDQKELQKNLVSFYSGPF